MNFAEKHNVPGFSLDLAIKFAEAFQGAVDRLDPAE